MKREAAQAWTLNTLASAYSLSGQPRRAIPLIEKKNELREKLDDKRNVASGLGNVAISQWFIGALSAAERNHRKAASLCQEIGDEQQEGLHHYELGRVLSYIGKWNEADKESKEGLKLLERIGHIQAQSIIWSYRALHFLLLVRADSQSKIVNLKSAIESAQRALELADETARTQTPFPRDYVRAYWLLGAAYRMNNELTLAEENLSKALNLCRQINAVDAEADILLDVARLYYAQGDFKDAQEKASESLVITERCGYVLQGADVNLFLAELALTRPFGAPSPDFGRGKSEHSEDGVRALARKYAEEAKRLATCDGGEYKYKVAYEEAERMIERLKDEGLP